MDWISEFRHYLEDQKRYSGATVCNYMKVVEDYCAGFLSEAGSCDMVSAMKPVHVRGYMAMQLEKGLSPRTVNLHLSALSTFSEFLVRKSVIDSNPVHNVTRPRNPSRLPHFFPADAMSAYVDEADRVCMQPEDSCSVEEGRAQLHAVRDKLMVNMIYMTGMRRSEICSLKVSSFDFSRQVVRVSGKGNKIREIPLTSFLIEEIVVYLDKRKKYSADDFESFFLTDRGNPVYPAFVDRIVKKELKISDGFTGRRSPHVLRHTFATHLLNSGADLYSIKEVLGHTSLAATQVYTHNSFEQLKKTYLTAHPRAKKGDTMEIRVQSVKFNADQKLLDFIDKKIGKLEKFYENLRAEVTLTLLPEYDNKNVKVHLFVAGKDILVERNAQTFEDAVVDCADILKEQIVKAKEKQRGV